MFQGTRLRRSICGDTLFSRKRKRYCWHGRTLGRLNKPLTRQERFCRRPSRKPNCVVSRRLTQVRLRLSRAPGKDASTGQRVKPRVRLKALVIQGGEIPPPVKPNQQPVLSLGVEAVRSDLSVDKGVCEPQCESVKPISPVNYVMRRSRLFSESQTASSRPFWSGLLGLRRGRWAWRAYEG